MQRLDLDWRIHIFPDPVHVHLRLSLLLRCQLVKIDDILDPVNEFDKIVSCYGLLVVDECVSFSDESLNILDYLAQITDS